MTFREALSTTEARDIYVVEEDTGLAHHVVVERNDFTVYNVVCGNMGINRWAENWPTADMATCLRCIGGLSPVRARQPPWAVTHTTRLLKGWR